MPTNWANWRRYSRAAARAGGRGAWSVAPLRALLAVVSDLGWRLDSDAPAARDVVLVIGHQRSGTTWLHRVLAAHPEAAAMPLHALLLPADAWQRPLSRRRRSPWTDRLQDRLFGGLDPLHRIRLHEPEEDEFLLWAAFRSPMNALDRPWPGAAAPRIDVDDGGLDYYAQAVARAVRRTGRRHVGKNPHFTWRTGGLRRRLPGLRLIQLVRHPAEAIASRLGLIEAIWRRRGYDGLRAEDVERIYGNSLRCYREGHGRADLDVPYGELLADPVGTVERVRRAAGFGPLTAELRAFAGASLRAPRPPLAPERFGLDRHRIAADLRTVYARWGFRA